MIDKCIICNSSFKKINEFVYKCHNCLFYKSTLKPGFGQEIEGINEVRINNFKKIINIIKNHQKKNELKILEIGSGDGFFIEECKNQNINIIGSEGDDEQFKNLKKKFSNIKKISLPLKNDFNEFNKFDYIVFNDVFEHLENLNLVLSQLKKFLNINGKIVINLPSSSGLIFKFSEFISKFGITNFYNRLWQKDLSSPHLSYFNNSNLSMLFKNSGYNLIYSGYLNTVSKKGNFKRLNSTIRNKLVCLILSSILFLFFYFQKIFPKDIILHIYELKLKNQDKEFVSRSKTFSTLKLLRSLTSIALKFSLSMLTL